MFQLSLLTNLKVLCVCVLQIEPQVSVSLRKVFGESLLSHLKSCGQEIAEPIQECVKMLLRTGLREEVSHWINTYKHKC